MKFAEHLSAHITPEWRKQYINYEEMKAMLYAAVEQAPSAELIEPEVLTRYFAKFDEQFFHYCDKELAKINTFYSEKLAEATRKFANLSSELSEAQEEEFHGKEGLLRHGPNILRKRDVPARKIQELKLAFSEFYLSLILLQNYQTLNFTGFRKILKKHDKGRIVLAPLFYVNFADFWLADQLNSLVVVFVDFQYFICFYLTNHKNFLVADDVSNVSTCDDYTRIIRPIVGCLPAWWRFAQCLRRYRDTKEAFPHLVNAGKYATSFLVMLFTTLNLFNEDNYPVTSENPYFYLWLLSSILSSCYAYTWDIKMDWGLFDKKAGDNKYLREEIVYSSTGYYYFAIVEDFILRFGWALNLSLTSMGYVHSDIMICILSPLEVFRRFVWNFFRLENEHLNNCGKFRAVRDISVAPMDSSDQTQILRMMDEEDGVVNRRKKKPVAAKKKEDHRLLLEGESTDDPDS
ncbi:Xenotropic and polytropic retrovirus receptor 1 [Blattella germanica]|nr:Xenotropic and polytropic retrovirus receptor 1 [Blattella germanica]